jgi:arachidonate 15-lipoxygenase
MKPYLPQNDPNELFREIGLTAKRIQYQYDYTYIEPLPMLKRLPIEALPSLKWLALVADVALELLRNTILAKKSKSDENGQPEDTDIFETYLTTQKLLKSNDIGIGGLNLTLQETLKMLSTERIIGPGDNFEEYDKLFQSIPLPKDKILSDSEFARMRVAGPNPLVIKAVTALDAHFPVTEAQFQSVLPGDSLAAAEAEGRLFLADYTALAEVVTGNFPDHQKYLAAPLALFAVPPAASPSRSLVTIAIQCGQTPDDNPIITPARDDSSEAEKWAWNIAKTIVQIADANYHELISHLGLTHLLIEPFAIATQRQLASAHPLGILLRPHFEGTLLINDLAQKFLTGQRDPVDELLAGTFKASQLLSAQAIQNLSFNDNLLPDTFATRGVQAGSLPEYPYRDDALLIWNAIHQWVSEYLEVYYTNEADIVNDFELQNWARELISQAGGKITNFGEDGAIRTREYLIDATTQIIFTASAQHAAVNFPQATLMSYAPSMPMAGYIPVPNNFDAASEQDFFNLLPPIKQAQGQLGLTYLLGSVYYTKLGNYSNLIDEQVQASLKKFQANLKEIEDKIIFRNTSILEKAYLFLLPSKIPQSINI